MKHIILTCLLGVMVACGGKEDKAYHPEGHTKLTDQEILDRLEKGQMFNPTKLIFKSTDGLTLSNDSVAKLFRAGETYGDQYIDSTGEVKIMILRPMTDEDKTLLEKINVITRKKQHEGHNH